MGQQLNMKKKNFERFLKYITQKVKILAQIYLQINFKNSVYERSYASWRTTIKIIFVEFKIFKCLKIKKKFQKKIPIKIYLY